MQLPCSLVFITEVLDVLVEKIQGTENDDIAVLLLGYEEWPHTKLHHKQSPKTQVVNPSKMTLQSQLFKSASVIKHQLQEPISAMLRNQNPGLARRFPLEMAFRFEDYTDQANSVKCLSAWCL